MADADVGSAEVLLREVAKSVDEDEDAYCVLVGHFQLVSYDMKIQTRVDGWST